MSDRQMFGSDTLLSVEIRTDPDSCDYMAYRIIITTDKRTLTIRGCHDQGPEMTEEPNPPAGEG